MTKHLLEGKDIIVAGGGIAGSAFVAALHKLWDPTLTLPKITVFDRDTREVSANREGYSLSLNGIDKDGGLVALQQLGLLDEILGHSVLGINAGKFEIWDQNWGSLLALKPKPYGNLPTATMRIARKDLRRILIENAEKANATFNWGCACTAAERLENGRIRVTVTDEAGQTSTDDCDLLVAADGAHSKIRASFRPDDSIKYAGAIQMGGNGKFPGGPLPSPVDEDWGLMLSGQGVCCFFSAVDKENVVWGLSRREPERQGHARNFSTEQLAALKKEALELGHMFAEPFRTIVEATDAATAFYLPARDKEPFKHDESLEGIVFIGDANHAVSPFAGNGANLALKDGWDLAEKFCQRSSWKAAVAAYDAASYPRAVATLKTSHQRIGLGHCTGIKYTLFLAPARSKGAFTTVRPLLSAAVALTRATARTPARTPSTAKKPTGSTGKQQSILGFFSKPAAAAGSSPLAPSKATPSAKKEPSTQCLKESKSTSMNVARRSSNITPVPSSDAIEPSSSQENRDASTAKKVITESPPSVATRTKIPKKQVPEVKVIPTDSSPSRKAKKAVSYAESSDDEDEDVFLSLRNNRTRPRRTRTALPEDDEDDYDVGGDGANDEDDDEMVDFVVSDDSDATPKSKKRKRPPPKSTVPRKRSHVPSSPSLLAASASRSDDEDEAMEELPSTSTAQQWKYDPDNIQPSELRKAVSRPTPNSLAVRPKPKAHTREPEDRYPWLANIMDINKNPPGHPDYDPGTIYVPPSAWNQFSPFEKQYWEIKQKLWTTVVFFKKGKFYELYENDATIGHQLFDLKLTDRVNMRMVGVPESSLDIWVNQFVAKGYKVARVDQMESALGKEMRERETKQKKADKIIRRELACILTGGTLVEGSMLQDDNATYCAAIKESMVDDKPHLGIAFVDAATGQFFISEFEDDVDLTKFETFVAQIAPRELLLEKSHLSTKALRILKNNTSPTTIWNYLKSGTEFWDADRTRRELDCSGYFVSKESQEEVWPEKLNEVKDKDLLMSALGALTQYLRVLKLERDLLSQGNFTWYNPIHRDGTLILDGQTLINLEIFTNTVNGGTDGTLFSLLNRCVTPFGKRLFRQWVCHPLCNIQKINERLDAVDMLNADRSIREQFTSQMTRMPDLERLISRIHAGSCKPGDFVKVLEGFEQIDHTMGLLGKFGGGNSLVNRLLAAMPDLKEPLAYWESAFDRRKARDEKLLIPKPEIEEDFDSSQDELERIKNDLQTLLEEQKGKLKCKTLKFSDVGKEIYQVEAPKSVKVPSNWRQMSATAAVKRYYFKQLEDLVRELQEAEETHSQIVKEVASRFYQRFDVDYEVWLQAIRIISQLDCLISLAKTSSALGQPSCRPVFVDDERSVIEFEELRHPCMLDAVADFIPNDIKLGGDEAKINLLTGANAAGKSTILRMSCVAVIMAQIGCYVPAISARLTPVDRIMSRLGANDNIFAAQSTFFVELSETKKILSEATPRSLVILDELGRGTSSYDGVAVAQAVLHHVASHIGCVGYFATHYHSLATEFENHPEIRPRRMQIHVDDENRRVTFLYKLEDGVAEGSFGMHCAAMCGISNKVIERAEVAAKEWEHTSRLKESLERAKTGCYIPLGILSDVASLLRDEKGDDGVEVNQRGVEVLLRAIEAL
ncbi:putative dna mismatch repair protein msh6 protein [Diplogelasinospora grovesii]|uniref:DNA mismatch repair protein MSH6 n=1 Tax=Diplogelasinospora grovesii TaxID=303347 RepID=A0AAN6RYZ2_9PEZI|nr:putative dna mismatch repair protein msh6 protein [Diplogelasinospora grovesii]